MYYANRKRSGNMRLNDKKLENIMTNCKFNLEQSEGKWYHYGSVTINPTHLRRLIKEYEKQKKKGLEIIHPKSETKINSILIKQYMCPLCNYISTTNFKECPACQNGKLKTYKEALISVFPFSPLFYKLIFSWHFGHFIVSLPSNVVLIVLPQL